MSTLIDEEPEAENEPEYAVPGKRVFVALIDVINCWILSYLLSFLFSALYDHAIYILSILVMTIYKIIAEKTGLQTFGKKMYKLEVVSKEFTMLSWSNVLRRNSIWMILLIGYMLYYYLLIPSYGGLLSDFPSIYSFLNLSYILRFAALILLVDMGFVFITPARQSLHDILGETIVIDKP